MSSPTYTPPTSPARDVSNPHAYAVKTTSSGLLTRSNSANTRPGLTSHSYAPVCPPSPTPLGTPKSHRPRRSLSHIQPASSHLPSFPPPASPARRLDFTGRHHSYAGPSHSEAFPSFSGTLEMPLNKQRKSVRDPDDRNAPVEYWSSTRLSSWFVNLDCLANFGISMDTANDIAGFVKENGISGSNLVNITEAGLLSLHADHAWIPTIFSASRHLATTTHAIPEEMEMLRNDPFVMQRGSPAHSERLPGSTRVRRIAASFEESVRRHRRLASADTEFSDQGSSSSTSDIHILNETPKSGVHNAESCTEPSSDSSVSPITPHCEKLGFVASKSTELPNLESGRRTFRTEINPDNDTPRRRTTKAAQAAAGKHTTVIPPDHDFTGILLRLAEVENRLKLLEARQQAPTPKEPEHPHDHSSRSGTVLERVGLPCSFFMIGLGMCAIAFHIVLRGVPHGGRA